MTEKLGMGNVKNVFIMVWVEAVMEVKTRFKYGMSAISDFVVFSITFLAVVFFTNVKNMNGFYHTTDGIMLMLIGYMLWNTGVVAMDVASQSIESDAKTGILESEMQSKFPLWFLLIVRSFISNILLFIYLILLSLVTVFFAKISLLSLFKANLLVFIFSGITNFGMFGIGLIFGGGSLRFKRLGQWSTMLQAGMLLIANVAIPYEMWPQLVIPFGGGIEIVRMIYLGHSIDTMFVFSFLIINVAWFICGLTIFNLLIKRERRVGSFDTF